jgi:hypothetical protein
MDPDLPRGISRSSSWGVNPESIAKYYVDMGADKCVVARDSRLYAETGFAEPPWLRISLSKMRGKR